MRGAIRQRVCGTTALVVLAAASVAVAGCQGVIGDGAVEQAEGGEPGGPDAADPTSPGTGGPDGGGQPGPGMDPSKPWLGDGLGSVMPDNGGNVVTMPQTPTTDDPDATCVDDETFFVETAWPQVFGSKCLGCHSVDGIASGTRHVLVDAYASDFVDTNLAVLESLAPLTDDTGLPLLLSKPTGGASHAGGEIFTADSAEYAVVEALLARFDDPTPGCDAVDDPTTPGTDPDPTPVDVEAHLELMSPVETLRTATLTLTGRLPDAAELAAVEQGGELALAGAVATLLDEPAFLTRVKEIYNDILLTDKYLTPFDAIDSTRYPAIQLLDSTHHPGKWWFRPEKYGAFVPDSYPQASAADQALGNEYANDSVAREPLELIAWVVGHDRPLTEILTADYIVVNPFSARVYSVFDQIQWADPTDPGELHEARIPGFNHAGVLSSPMWLNRFPTTETNVNRHRSRMLYRQFLATDILGIAEQPVDTSSILVDNPTLNSPACNVCHTVMDPVASAFQNWDLQGRYTPPASGWHTDMLPAGFGTEVIPTAELDSSLPWLAERVAGDPRFVTATVALWFEALTGRAPLLPPSNELTGAGFATALAIFQRQSADLEAMGDAFVASGYDLKALVAEIVMSPYFRAVGVDRVALPGTDAAVERELELYGMARLLTPEQLNRKIVATLGFPFRSVAETPDFLLKDYEVAYGGINSDDVTERAAEMSGLMANVAARMSNHMACVAVPQDFVLPASQRLLFPHVERSTLPAPAPGAALDAAAVAEIKANIAHLHAHLLGEELAPGDPELEATFALFYDTWRDGYQAVASGQALVNLDNACKAGANYWTNQPHPDGTGVSTDADYTVRAWMAVVTYLLADFRYLHK